MTCSCRSTAELCALCREGLFAQLRGTAAARGERWAVSVRELVSGEQPWPMSDRMRAIARHKVGDLTRDPQLLELLADELVRWAEKRWGSAADRSLLR